MKWYQYDIRALTADVYQKWYALMSRDKQLRVDRFRFDDDKKRTVAGEMLARKAIAQWCKVPVEDIVFCKQETGKPYAKDLPVEFNISHSGDVVVCAVDDRPVGIDVEQLRPVDLKVARRICTEQELYQLFGYAPMEQDFAYTTDGALLLRFFKLWTAKEALCKLEGVGIGRLCSALDRQDVQIDHIHNGAYVICTAETKQNL